MTEGTSLVVAPAQGLRPVERSHGDADDGGHVASAAERIDLNVLRGALAALGGPDSPGRISSQSMGVLSRGVYGTLGMGDMTQWGKSASVGADVRVAEERSTGLHSDTSRRKQCSVPASPTSVYGFNDDHVAIDVSVLEQSMMRTPEPRKVSSNVLDEFPDLNLKPIRTRTPVNKLPTVHVTKSKPCEFKGAGQGELLQYGYIPILNGGTKPHRFHGSYLLDTVECVWHWHDEKLQIGRMHFHKSSAQYLVQMAQGVLQSLKPCDVMVCFGGGMWRIMARLGTAMGVCVAAVMYAIGME